MYPDWVENANFMFSDSVELYHKLITHSNNLTCSNCQVWDSPYLECNPDMKNDGTEETCDGFTDFHEPYPLGVCGECCMELFVNQDDVANIVHDPDTLPYITGPSCRYYFIPDVKQRIREQSPQVAMIALCPPILIKANLLSLGFKSVLRMEKVLLFNSQRDYVLLMPHSSQQYKSHLQIHQMVKNSLHLEMAEGVQGVHAITCKGKKLPVVVKQQIKEQLHIHRHRKSYKFVSSTLVFQHGHLVNFDDLEDGLILMILSDLVNLTERERHDQSQLSHIVVYPRVCGVSKFYPTYIIARNTVGRF